MCVLKKLLLPLKILKRYIIHNTIFTAQPNACMPLGNRARFGVPLLRGLYTDMKAHDFLCALIMRMKTKMKLILTALS